MHPFTDRREDSVAALGETTLLDRIREWLGEAAPPSPHGMGDDTAVLPRPEANLITTDSLVWGRHFDDAVSPGAAGAKLLKRNLSDIAAMGGRPREAVMAGFLPPETAISWLEAFTRGLAACATRFNVPIVGGDLTETDGFLGFNLTLLGHAPNPLLRAGAAIGDTLWVTGVLGGSRASHQHAFTPRIAEGLWLAQRGPAEIRALIDVTDGLAKDLPAILTADSTAVLHLDRLPASDDARAAAGKSGNSLLQHLLTDGEDYELLFALAAGVDSEVFHEAWQESQTTPLTCIGQIVPRKADAPLIDAATQTPLSSGSGYEHFAAP